MDEFRLAFHSDLISAMPGSVSQAERQPWLQSVAAWLYDTSHITIEYGIQYDGVAIEQLSPGTRGIVLLLLYSARRSARSPTPYHRPTGREPRSEIGLCRAGLTLPRGKKKRRQVIVVTHNANLVVNTDADQVIVATSVQTAEDGLPTISYRAGSLENPDIRSLVCEILEGGERAFLERERRYRLRWGEAISPPTSGRIETISE